MAYSRELFNRWIPGLLRREGGFNANVGGTGEYVNRGLTRSSYPNEDIKGMSEQRAKDLYFRDYWSQLPPGLSDQGAGVYFDALVHSGAGGAKRSFDNLGDPSEMIASRRRFLDRLSNSDKHSQFKGGWNTRIDQLERDITGTLRIPGTTAGSGSIPNPEATGPLDTPTKVQQMQTAYNQGIQQQQQQKRAKPMSPFGDIMTMQQRYAPGVENILAAYNQQRAR